MSTIKQRIYKLIRDDDKNNNASNIFDGIIIGLILLNVTIIILDTFSLPPWFQILSYYVEIISVIIFTIEYIIRVWVSDLLRPDKNPFKARLRYMLSFMAVIDLLAILPFYLPLLFPFDLRILRLLRLFRLLRILKMNRYTTALKTIADVFKRKANQLLSSLFVVTLLMVISSVIIYSVENPVQPHVFSNAFSGMWWAVVTLTTVGYGDIIPVTVAGKVFSAIIAILGIGLIAIPTGILSAGFVERTNRKEKEEAFK